MCSANRRAFVGAAKFISENQIKEGEKMVDRASLSHEQIEEGTELVLDFDKLKKVAACGEAIVPVAVQDADSGEVLIVAYVNAQALAYTQANGVAAFWSTSRNELWVKGATSGDFLDLVEVRVNCEQNSLLYRVRPRGEGACHTKESEKARSGCYYRRLAGGALEFVE
ncbi:MAG: phosphoribosyl-AMP cyclohydrolase [Candidatus Latescibacterota bacterium]|jgi:phosphoribosyl-AMP cyclohydrolase